MASRPRWLPLAAGVVAALFVLLAFASPAQAYPFMVRHQYSDCATCHTDPSGGSLLLPYGRAQSALLLSTRFNKKQGGVAGRPSEQLFGLAPLPEQLQLGADLRNAYLFTYFRGDLADDRFLQMRADLQANVHIGRFRAYGTLGYNREESARLSQRAWVTPAADWGNLVAREYWAGVDLSPRILLRGGRINQPFGLRIAEHTAWVRAETETDINQHQQHGASVVVDGPRFRGELMALLGNYQVAPDRYRERGYSAYLDFYLTNAWAAGLSSRITRAETSLTERTELVRQAHGVFTRVAVVEPLVLMGELDLLLDDPEDRDVEVGHVSLLQADFEIVSGLHAMATAETLNRGDDAGGRFGGWLSAWWFFFPHFDARVDYIMRTSQDGAVGTFQEPATHTLLLMLHAYL